MKKTALTSKYGMIVGTVVLSVFGYAAAVFAAPNLPSVPAGGYLPGTELDPVCAPNDPDCLVVGGPWDRVAGGINYAGGNVGIGTTNPGAKLDVAGMIRGTNLDITGDAVTVGVPGGTLAATFDYSSGSYPAEGYEHSYRVYSYKDVSGSRIYSSSYLTIATPSGTAPQAPSNVTALQTCADGCNYDASGHDHNYRVYGYKTVGDQRIYSTTYADLPVNFIDDNSSSNYDITVSWTASPDADGYRVLKYDPSYNGYNYDYGYDTANTSFVDDACGTVCFGQVRSSVVSNGNIIDDSSVNNYNINVSWNPVSGADGYRVLKYDPYYSGYNYDAGYDTTSTSFVDDACTTVCFDGAKSQVGQIVAYTNAATINGTLSLTGPIIMQGSPIRLDANRNFGVITDISTLTGTNNILLGTDAGQGVTDIDQSVFIGFHAGAGSVNASNSLFLGAGAGQDSTDVDNSAFMGFQAGHNSTGANHSAFTGYQAGKDSTGAYYSSFTGQYAGYGSIDANNTSFLGVSAGQDSTGADHSAFTGYNAGQNSTGADHSAFTGYNAGQNSTGASSSLFAGYQAGQGSTGASASVFIGYDAGQDSTGASSSLFVGYLAGQDSTGASNSVFSGTGAGAYSTGAYQSAFVGNNAGYNSSGANNSSFLGYYAGQGSTGASRSDFTGYNAGYNSTGASNSSFVGIGAGIASIDASSSSFIGPYAGQESTGATNSTFMGISAGGNSAGATGSVFTGALAGQGSTGASNSAFMGISAGGSSAGASRSVFTGAYAGYNSSGANNSLFMGNYAGQNDIVNNTNSPDDFSILIGNNSHTGGYSNSIALGSYATNTASNQLMIGSTTRSIDTVRIQGSSIGTQCTITTGTGIACTSDERLKANIADIPGDALTRLANVRTVHYNLIGDTTGRNQVGFLAQNLEQYFPELVDTNSDGYKSVYYAQMTPILVEAVKELDIKLADIQKVADATDQTLVANIRNWLASATNGIAVIVSDTLRARNQICIDDVCMTRDQLRTIIQNSGSAPVSGPAVPPSDPVPPATDPETPPADPATPPSDPVTPVTDPAPEPDPAPAPEPAPSSEPTPQ